MQKSCSLLLHEFNYFLVGSSKLCCVCSTCVSSCVLNVRWYVVRTGRLILSTREKSPKIISTRNWHTPKKKVGALGENCLANTGRDARTRDAHACQLRPTVQKRVSRTQAFLGPFFKNLLFPPNAATFQDLAPEEQAQPTWGPFLIPMAVADTVWVNN